jgi:hypothetical protein
MFLFFLSPCAPQPMSLSMVTSIQIWNIAENFQVSSYCGSSCTEVSKNDEVLKYFVWNRQKSNT